MSSHGSGASNKIPEGEGTAGEDDASFPPVSQDSRMPEIIEAVVAGLPIQVNTYNRIIVRCALLVLELSISS